jgi:hypothetical protein
VKLGRRPTKGLWWLLAGKLEQAESGVTIALIHYGDQQPAGRKDDLVRQPLTAKPTWGNFSPAGTARDDEQGPRLRANVAFPGASAPRRLACRHVVDPVRLVLVVEGGDRVPRQAAAVAGVGDDSVAQILGGEIVPGGGCREASSDRGNVVSLIMNGLHELR